MNKKKFVLSIIIIFLIALVAGNIFGRYMAEHYPRTTEEVDGFGHLGRQFATSGNLGGSIRVAPLFPVLIGLIIKIFGDSSNVLLFFQTVLLGMLGVFVFLISYDNFKSLKIAFFTGIITVLHPMCLWYVLRLWAELLFANLLILMIWSAYKVLSNSTWRNLIVFGVLTGITTLCKAVVSLFPIFLAGSVFVLHMFRVKPFQSLSRGTLLKFFIVPISAMLLVVLPWTIRNHNISGE